MGRMLEGLARVLGFGLLLVLFVPALALVPAMVVDRGFDGRSRISAFPAALVILDPLVWRCARNSVAVALAVTVGSSVVGTGLGLILGRRRFWGRRPLGILAVVPLAMGPIWTVPGVVLAVGGGSSWDWLAARSFLGQPGDDWARWMALVWASLAGATPLVILATRAGLARVDPAWADAARVVGAGRFRVWLDVTWPTIRPGIARVAGLVFTLTLVEPAGPTILGLRRTLAVEMADAAFRFDDPNRAATLAVIAIAIACATRSLLARWAGPVLVRRDVGAKLNFEPRAGTRLGGFAVLGLLIWAGFSLGPMAAFARRMVGDAVGDRPITWATIRSVVESWATPEARIWAANSAVTATLAVGLDLILLAVLATGWRRAARPLAAVPPMAMAVGALAIPPLLATWAARAAEGSNPLEILQVVRAELSTGRSPGFLLVIVLAAVYWPILDRATTRPPGADLRRASTDAALLVGASSRQARRVGRPRVGIFGGGSVLLAWAWAGTDLASAWVLTSLDERRTLATAALDLLGSGAEPLDPRLLGLFLATTGLKLLAMASVARSTRAGDWLAAR